MASLQERIQQLQSAIAAQEALRSTLGDAVVDTTIAALRSQLDPLLADQSPLAPDKLGAYLAPEQLLARLLPKELADKMRATGRIEGERKQVTVVFADLSSFTTLAEQLDPEIVRGMQEDLLPELASAVYQYEGYIDKFLGDAIMAIFGAPIAHEDDPERALRAALAMRVRMEALNRRWSARLGQPLALHVGINTGTVIVGEISSDAGFTYTVTGDTVNTTSRLQSAAQPGQILVSRSTHRLTSEAFQFQALEPMQVKGKREPLEVFEVVRAKLNPLKTRGLQGLSSRLVGRERERDLLRGVTSDLLAGRGRIVTVSGEAGLGKSRLMSEWRAETGERVRWLEGRAFAHTVGVAYGPFIDLFRRYAGIQDDDSEPDARRRMNATVSSLFGDDREAHALFASMLAMRLTHDESELLASMPAQTARDRLFAVFLGLLARGARQMPIVLMIEDMHWADRASLDLVESLLPLVEWAPLAIVAVFREQPGAVPSQFVRACEARYSSRLLRLDLAPLTESASLDMVSQLLSLHELPASLRHLILGKAEGNPFFVEEVIRTLIERGALMHANGQGWVTTAIIDNISVPDTLQGLLMARLDRLPDETKWVVQQASVIGRIFLYRVLLQMAENQASVDADLTQLEREELIRERARDPEIEYIFKHALTQEVAYQSLLAPRRRELHRKVGEAMEMLFAQRISEFQSIIGHHMLRGEVWGKAAMHLIAAGDSAARLYAHAEAREHYAGALDAIAHLPDTTDNRIRRIDATIRLVSVSVVSDDPGQNLARLHAVEPLAQSLPSSDGKGDPLRLARIHYWMGRSHFYRNESREAIGYYRQVLAVAQETGDPELLALPASTLGQVALLIQGQFARARPLLAQAVAPLEHAGDWSEWIRAVGYLGLATAAMGEYRQGLVESERALARARETHNLTGAALVYLLQSGIYLQGREHHRMVETVQACLALNEQTGDRLQAYIAHAELAWAQSRLGDHAGAAESMARSQEIGSALGGRLVTADWFAAANAELALNAGQFDLAAERALSAIQVAQGVGSAFSEGMACRIYAEALAHLAIGRWAEAQAQFAASVQRLESGGALLEVAHTRAAWGRELAAHGDASGARTSLEQAEAQFARSELAGPAQAVRVLLDGLVEEQRA